jgi:hypothetical protein
MAQFALKNPSWRAEQSREARSAAWCGADLVLHVIHFD